MDGKVYDLVAGIKDGGASCVDQEIDNPDEGIYQWGNKKLTKNDSPGSPWLSGYDITEED